MQESKIMVKEFFDQTGLYLHKRFGIRLRREIINELIPPVLYENVMDVGCGDGTLILDRVEKAKTVCMIDLSVNMLDLAKKNIESVFPLEKEKVEYFNGDFVAFNGSEKFDLILIIGVLAHVPDLDAVFKKIKKLLKPNGVAVIQYSNSNNTMIQLSHLLRKIRSNYTLNKITDKTVTDLCTNNQFLIVASKRFNFPFFGMKYIRDESLYTIQRWLMNQAFFTFLLADRIFVLKNK